MKRYLTFSFVNFMLMVSLVSPAQAEIKNVQMKIAGYLCGN